MDSYGGNYEAVANGGAASNPRMTSDRDHLNRSEGSRAAMTEEEERARRASIRAIMNDVSIPPAERRRSIQALMDGRRNSSERQKSIDNSVNNALKSNGGNPNSRLDLSKAMVKACTPCTHYERKCVIISPCCGAPFGCRICHDECPVLPPEKYGVQANGIVTAPTKRHPRSSSLPSSWTNMPESNVHKIDRFAIREIICRQCFTRQTSKTNECINCHTTFGEYHCDICNLWMAEKENPYHCHECGFCRVGGSENFRHCKDCGMCIDVSLFSDHNCKSGKYMSNCPVCQEDLFSSRSASHEMPCGHTIHWHCYQQLARHDSRCPICKKTSESSENMMQTWRAIALSIMLQPLPNEHAKLVDISCIDCETQDQNLRWHFLGVQCRNCNSFNTHVDRVTLTGERAVQFSNQIERLQANIIRGGLVPTDTVDSVGEVMPGYARSSFRSSMSSIGSQGVLSQVNAITSNQDGEVGDSLIVDFDPERRRSLREGYNDEENDDENHSMDLS